MRRALPVLVAAMLTATVVAPACAAATGGGRPAWRAAQVDPPTPPGTTRHLASVVAGSPGGPWLLGGNTTSGPGPPQVGFWRSDDAMSWTPGAAHGLTLDAPQNLVFGIARLGSTAVAVGETPGMAHGNPRPTVWRSTDGSRWDEVPTLREDFGGPRLTDLRAVTAGPSGFAIVGNWTTDDGRPVIAVWLSADGRSWEREDHIAQLTSGTGEELTAMGVAGGPGGLVITGESYVPTPGHFDHVNGFIATSPDGRRWTRVDDRAAALDNGGQVAVRAVTGTADGWVAIGTRAAGRRAEVTVWHQAAGGAWRASTLATTGYVQSTSVTDDGATTRVASVDDGAVRLWAAGRGGRWRSVAGPPAAGVQSVVVAAAQGRVVLATQTAAGAALWTTRPA